MEWVTQYIPAEAVQVLMVLGLAALLGFERETRKTQGSDHYYFGGATTFPLLGLIGFGAGVLSKDSLLPVAAGLLVVGGFMLVSYRHKLAGSSDSGFVTELAGLIAYLQGSLVYFEHYWLAASLVILTLLILKLKNRFERLGTQLAGEEVLTLAQFLFLTVVILPILPNQEFTQFKLNPFKIWLVVVVVSALSYLGYILQHVFKERGGVLLSALIGGTYSSGAVTMTLAKRSRETQHPHLYSGAAILSCGLMFFRVIVVLAIFNRSLMAATWLPLAVLGSVTMLGAYLWSRIKEPGKKHEKSNGFQNPLELTTALILAAVFIVILVLTQVVVKYFGNHGIYYLAASAGAMDVDPFVISVSQNAGGSFPVSMAAVAVLIAVTGNNLLKASYALIIGEKQMARQTALGLLAVILMGLAAILMMLPGTGE